MIQIPNQRNRSIDNIKVIAICFIIITHIPWTDIQRQQLLFPFWIDLAVPILMIITGINWYNSTLRNDGLFINNVLRYLKRILIPFGYIIFIECIIMLINGTKLTSVIFDILCGGYGPGSYYTIIMIQIILIFQVIYDLVTKYRFGGLLLIVIQFLFEIFVAVVNLSPFIYRLCCLRYLVFIVAGIWYVRYEKSIKEYYKYYTIFSFLLGEIAIFYLNYSHVSLSIFKQWTVTSLPTVFFSFFIFLILGKLKYYCNIIYVISNATYHIYLTQMIYYFFLFPYIQNFLCFTLYTYIPINIIICIVGGVLFYKLEKIMLNYQKSFMHLT